VFVEVRGYQQFWCLRELKKLGGRRPAGTGRRWDAMMFEQDPVVLDQVAVVVRRTMGLQITLT
jgi:hypothetical protein